MSKGHVFWVCADELHTASNVRQLLNLADITPEFGPISVGHAPRTPKLQQFSFPHIHVC